MAAREAQLGARAKSSGSVFRVLLPVLFAISLRGWRAKMPDRARGTKALCCALLPRPGSLEFPFKNGERRLSQRSTARGIGITKD